MTLTRNFSWRAWNSPSCAIRLSAKADAIRRCARGMGTARLNTLGGGGRGTLRKDRADKHLVSLDSGDTLRQGRALGDGKVVHLLVRCTCTRQHVSSDANVNECS